MILMCMFTLNQLLPSRRLTTANYLYPEVTVDPFFGYPTAPLVVFAMSSNVVEDCGPILLGGLLAFGYVVSLDIQPA